MSQSSKKNYFGAFKKDFLEYCRRVFATELLLKKIVVLLTCAALVMSADFAVKIWAINLWESHGSPFNFDGGSFLFIKVGFLRNDGIAFNTFSGSQLAYLLPLIIVSATLVAWAFASNLTYAAYFVLICFGGWANLIDRFINGSVVDMFSLTFIKNNVWNVADAFVSLTTAVFIIHYFVWEFIIKRDKPKNDA